MIVANDVGPGLYPFFWEGGLTQVTYSASDWGGQNANLQWTAEDGETYFFAVVGPGNGTTQVELPPGNYNAFVNTAMLGATVTVTHILG